MFIKNSLKCIILQNLIFKFSRMSPTLQMANFEAQVPSKQLGQVIKNLIFMRKHKQIAIQKPVLNFNVNDQQWHDINKNKSNGNYFKTHQQQRQENQKTCKILLQKKMKQDDPYKLDFASLKKAESEQINHTSKINNINLIVQQIHPTIPYRLLKRKLIKKAIGQTIDKNRQIEVQKKYCKYLLNSLHKRNLLLINNNIPPNLSVLQTIDDGDYLQEGDRKDFPHYSNVLQPIQLPQPRQNVRIIRDPVRFDPCEHVFCIQENTVFKVKHIYLLIQKLFEQSIRICEMIREMNYKGDDSLKIQNQNHDFEKLASMIGLNYKTCKLLYDMLNDHYDIQKQLLLGKSDDSKTRSFKQLVNLVQNEIKQYFSKKSSQSQQSTQHSSYIPLQQYYLSLKDLRQIFIQVYEEKKSK